MTRRMDTDRTARIFERIIEALLQRPVETWRASDKDAAEAAVEGLRYCADRFMPKRILWDLMDPTFIAQRKERRDWLRDRATQVERILKNLE